MSGAARTEDDAHALAAQQIPGAHEVIDVSDLMIHMLDAGACRLEQRDLVVNLVDAQERRVADAIADAGAERADPETLVAHRIGRAQPDMAEAGDARRAPGNERAGVGVLRPHDQIDRVAGGVAERNQRAHVSMFAIGGLPLRTGKPASLSVAAATSRASTDRSSNPSV